MRRNYKMLFRIRKSYNLKYKSELDKHKNANKINRTLRFQLLKIKCQVILIFSNAYKKNYFIISDGKICEIY